MPESIAPELQDICRLAAFIDGEGCVSIRRAFRNKNGRYFHHLRIQVANADGRLPLWLRSVFGGNIHINRSAERLHNWRTVYTWEVTGKKAAAILELCLPYLVIKAEQAEVGLQFHRELTGFGRNGRGNFLEESIYQQREEACVKLQAMKRVTHPVEVN